MVKRSRVISLAAVLVVVLTAPAFAHDEEDAGDQHGSTTGHLPGSSQNVQLVGKVKLTDVKGGIADVAAFGNYAYLNAFSPECAGRPGASGTPGVHIVDISDPSAPRKVGFIPADANSYLGEGIHIFHMSTLAFTGDVLVHNNETCDSDHPATGGVSIWNVTNPLAPVLLSRSGDTTPAVSGQTYHTTHSVQGFTQPGKAYVVLQDNQDLKDVDILDISNPTAPVLVSEVGLEDWPGAQGSYANGDSVFHHDMQFKRINDHDYLLVSYWDAGQVLLNVDNPASPVFVTDSDFSSPDPEQPQFQIPEGNSHQSYWSQDGKYVISTDEDFSPTRTLFAITSGPNARQYGAGEFGWTVPISTAFPSGLTGNTVFGGSGCEEDLNSNGVSDRAEVPSATSSGADIVVFSRGSCFFSKKVETGQLAGYKAVIIGQSHAGSRNGLLPDSFLCGSQGHAFTVTVSAICTGHRAMHLLFNDPPAYSAPEGFRAGGDLPAIGTLGASISARTAFDGWGYAHLQDGATLAELDTYSIAEAQQPQYARGFGNLTVHEVKTDPRTKVDLAYFSWYSGGLRVASYGPGGLNEVGHYIADGGNDFWGVYPILQGAGTKNLNSAGRGQDFSKRPLLLMSDRDSGLWILRYTGQEQGG